MKRLLKWLSLLVLVAFGALLVWGYAPDRDPQALRAKYANAASRFVDVGGGLKIHVRDEGARDAPVLVLLHGSNSSLQTWEPWVKRLGGKYRIISLDQIGHGLTGPNPTDDYSPAAFVDTLDRTLTKIGVSRFALAGNSMGGGVAWHYALAHPEKLSGLILVDAAGAPEARGKSLPIGFRIAQMPVVNRLAEFITPRGMIAKSLHQSLSNQSIIDDRMIDRYWELLLYPGNRRATGLRFAAPRTTADPAALGKLPMPVLILWGAEDKLIPVASAHWFAGAMPQARLIIYPGIGHAPMEEAADRSADDVNMFMAGLAPPSQK